MGGLTIKVTRKSGPKNLRKEISPRVTRAMEDALREESMIAFAESQREVPHADGALMNSGLLTPPETIGNGKIEVVMSYGGAAAKYAARQHEDLSLNHPDPTNPHSRPGGKSKYLEDPARRVKDRISGTVRRNLKKAL